MLNQDNHTEILKEKFVEIKKKKLFYKLRIIKNQKMNLKI